MSGVDRNAHDHGETKSFKWQGHRISGFDVPRWQLVRAAAQANCLDGQSRLSGTSVHTNGGKGQHAVGKPMGKSWRKKKGELKKREEKLVNGFSFWQPLLPPPLLHIPTKPQFSYSSDESFPLYVLFTLVFFFFTTASECYRPSHMCIYIERGTICL